MDASDEGATLLCDFVNTLDVESGADALTGPATPAAWLAERGLVPAGTDGTPQDLALAIALREGLRAAMLGHHGPAPADLPEDLDDMLAALPLRLSFSGTSRPVLAPLDDHGVTAGLARIAAAVMDTVADGTWTRLKVCQEGTCRWAFLDTSRNRSRAWCSMRVCGNRTKTRAYRARHRAEDAETSRVT